MLETLKGYNFNSNQNYCAKFKSICPEYGVLVIETNGFNMNQIHNVGSKLKAKQLIVSNETKQGFSVEYQSYTDANVLSLDVMSMFEAEIEANKTIEITEEV